MGLISAFLLVFKLYLYSFHNRFTLPPLVYDEVNDRNKFMEEARVLGICSRYEAALNCEIAQKIKEMERIVHRR